MFKNTNKKAVSFGEILFDVFGEEKKVGGAPLNLALRMNSFGFPVTVISAVGNDENGEILKNYIHYNGVSTEAIITTPEYETGVVQVHLNDRGSATYEIKFPAAWDFIRANDHILKVVQEAGVFFFGSLSCRNDVSRNTLFSLLKSNPEIYKVLDINLRAPHYTMETLTELMDVADFIKLNDEEILLIAAELGFHSESLEENIRFIAEKTKTASICVTRGKHGSILFWENRFYHHGGYEVQVADTVGAGDSYLAALTSKLLSNNNPEEALYFASAVGAMVAASFGANPEIKLSDIQDFVKQHELQD